MIRLIILPLLLLLYVGFAQAKDPVFLERPVRWTTELKEYESADRNWALQEFANGGKVIRDRRNFESVAEYLLRHLILHVDSKDLTRVIPDRDLQVAAMEQNQKKIWLAYNKWSNAGYNVDPFNLLVRYQDQEKTTITEVVFEKPPAPAAFRETRIASGAKMLEQFMKKISEALRSKYFPIVTRKFQDVQEDKNSVVRPNVAGRRIRIAGVDSSYESFLLEHITEQLKKSGFQLVEAYYFGSRVMTRDILLEVDPQMKADLSVNKGQLVKNQVREGGLTNVSDLEVFLVVKPLLETQDIAEREKDEFQLQLRDKVRAKLNEVTRRYSLGMKLIVVDKESQRASHFPAIQEELRTKKNWTSSPEQYSQFYPSPRAQICEGALQ